MRVIVAGVEAGVLRCCFLLLALHEGEEGDARCGEVEVLDARGFERQRL